MFSFGRCSKSADLPNRQLIFYLYDLRQPPSQELCPGGIQLILVKRAVRQTQKVRQEYLQAESAWLSSEASHTAAKLDLTGAIENYQWALEGLLDIGSSSQS